MLAVKIYFLNFRFTKYITKKQYFDAELKEATGKLKRSYFTTIIFVAGVIASIYSGGRDLGGIICMAWVILDLLFINPAIYYALLPKPLSEHVFSEEEATEEMKKEEAGSGIDDLLSKYDPVQERTRRKK